MVHTHQMFPSSVDAQAVPAPRQAIVDARAELTRLVDGRCSVGPRDRLAYARDQWALGMLWVRQGRSPQPPDAVVWPETEAQLVELVKFARSRRFALIPFGAGSGVCGGTWAVNGGIAVDLKRFDAIGDVDETHFTVDVGAGVLGERLEQHLNARGWTLGHFPSSLSMSTVGGWLAARSAGQFSGRYGKIEDMVLSVRAVLGTAEVIETPERPFSGADLLPLLLGSEGTFAAFTRARVRVFPLAGGRAFRAFSFPSVERGVEAMRRLMREGPRPAVMRLYDPFDTAFVGQSRSHPATTPPSERGPLERRLLPSLLRTAARHTLGHPALLNRLQGVLRQSHLILVFEGDGRSVAAQETEARERCLELDGKDLGEQPARDWLRKRYDVSFRLSRLIDSGTFVDTFEVAAPWDQVLEVYSRVRQAAAPWAFVLCHLSHPYPDGCSLYFSFVGSGGDEADMQRRYQELWRVVLPAALSAGANLSHHHGVGLLKARAYLDTLGEGRQVLAQLKSVFDPDGILNPGKLGIIGRVPDRETRASGANFEPHLTPGSVAELTQGLHVLADAGARLNAEATLQRSKLSQVGAMREASMTIDAGAGVSMRELDAHARRAGLTLGTLSPGALTLTVGDFLEGPYAGLRAVPLGRLEPVCTRLEAVAPDGHVFSTPRAPRSAAGPDLAGLVLGGHGRLALVTSATMKCEPLPEREVRVALSCANGADLVMLLRRWLAEGLQLNQVHLGVRDGRSVIEVGCAGSRSGTERDRELLVRMGRVLGATVVDPGLPAVTGEEREVSWRTVQRAVDRGATLTLYRCSLSAAIAVGDVPGLSLSSPSPWSSRAERLFALDPRRVLGGPIT